MDLPNLFGQAQNRFPLHHCLQRLDGMALTEIEQHGALLLGAEIAQTDLEQEAVELGLGQRKGAFILDGVLRGQNQEGPRQGARHPVHCDLPFAHTLQQRGLRPGRGAVDFIGQQDIGESGAGVKLELVRLLVKDADPGDVAGQ